MEPCWLGWSNPASNKNGNCCCNCKYHLQDFHHCTTIDRVQYAIDTNTPAPENCVCSMKKGWICSPEKGIAYSGWTEHGMCEMHEDKDEYQL